MISKHRYSAFFETRLDSILRANGTETLIFIGATTSICIVDGAGRNLPRLPLH
ncbi:MAG TPA: isochorismatase family protein [Devosiaceae bacterium]|nr:isochorismatase family protein [Devosiaceae bacterium]